jgi:arylsulfatase A-like enzyme
MFRPQEAMRAAMLSVGLALSFLVSWSVSRADNVLVVVVDDVGVNMISSYQEGGVDTDYPVTPFIEDLANHGVLFRNAWASAVCSPTRGTIQTGRYPFRTGTRDVNLDATPGTSSLPKCELTIPEVLNLPGAGGAAHAAVGKWHIGGPLVGGADAPRVAGYSHFAGTEENIHSFYDWTKILNGVSTLHYANYATIGNVADAYNWIHDRGTQPWFLYLAFNAPHKTGPGYQRPPLPPPALFSEDLTSVPDKFTCPLGGLPDRSCYKAMLETVDYELDWLMDQVDPTFANTTVIFIGDNGTPTGVSSQPANKVKTSLYEGGINVPLIIRGPHITEPGRISIELVHSVDLFATVIEMISGLSPAALIPSPQPVLDSKSLVPILQGSLTPPFRDIVFTQFQNDVALRDQRYKLMVTGGVEKFFDLQTDPQEETDLTPVLAPAIPWWEAYNARAAMRAYRTSLTSVIDDCDHDGVAPPVDGCDEVFNPPPVATVVWPNGGNTLTVGETVTLQWTATYSCAGDMPIVDVLISRSGVNGTYELILDNTPNDGTQTWTVTGPANPGFTVFMKVVAQDPGGHIGSDVSNAGFKIKNPACSVSCQPSSYCSGEGVRCTWNGTCGGGGGCCNYSCASDPTCTLPDPCPENMCGGCF